MDVTFDCEIILDTSGPIPDKCTPWEDDIVLKKVRKTLNVFDIGVPIKNFKVKNCIGKIAINEKEKHLECEVLELDLNIYDYVENSCVFNLLPNKIQTKIIDSMKKKVVDAIPPIVLSPTIFDFDIKFIKWKVNVEARKLKITNHEAIVGAYIFFKELQNKITPVPKYIVNTNNMEIHLAGCDSVYDIYETHQEGYYLLHNALNKNYDGCKKCLPNFHKR
jgi:hypothetical protein